MKHLILLVMSVLLIAGCSSHKSTADKVTFETTAGSSFKKAIVVEDITTAGCITTENAWLTKNFPKYRLRSKTPTVDDKKHYDVIEITTADGQAQTIYFDV